MTDLSDAFIIFIILALFITFMLNLGRGSH